MTVIPFTDLFAAATRDFGSGRLNLEADAAHRLRAWGIDWPIERWCRDDLWRAALLLLAAGELPDPAYEALIEDCYRRGDTRERQAVLRTLPLLPRPERFTPIALAACRSDVRPVFDAIACENPFPARFFSELHFTRMVLRALFADVSLDRIVGLEARLCPEITRMAAEYTHERQAAGLPVAESVARIATLTWSTA